MQVMIYGGDFNGWPLEVEPDHIEAFGLTPSQSLSARFLDDAPEQSYGYRRTNITDRDGRRYFVPYPKGYFNGRDLRVEGFSLKGWP